MILNLTQHTATPDQVEAGVVDLVDSTRNTLVGLLTFNSLPTSQEIEAKALALAMLALDQAPADQAVKAMIGGAPYLMARLEKALLDVGIIPVYAFSERVSVEQSMEDGSVRKVNVFKHVGFVEAR